MGAGVAVLLWSINEDLNSGEIKEMIMRGVRVEGEGENARYVIDFSVSGDLAILSRSGNLDLGVRIPELGDIVPMPWLQVEREAVVEIGYLVPKAVECAVYDDTTADGDPAYEAPKCPENVEGCSSCGLLDGNGNGGYPEPNQPNTLLWIGARYTWDGSECTYKSNIDSGGNDVREWIYTEWFQCWGPKEHKGDGEGVGE
jgi:hypothetical protein